MEKASRCGMCGTSEEEWAEDPYAYDAVRVVCPGCMRRETMSDDKDAPMGKGASIKLLPKAAAARLAEEVARKAADGTLRPRRRSSQ